MKTRFFELVRFGIARNYSHIVARDNVFDVRHTYGERFSVQKIFCGLMSCADAHGKFVAVADTAPCVIHRVGFAAFVISGKNENRLRISIRFCTEIFSHIHILR